MRSPIQRPLSSHLSWNISRLKLQRTVNVSPTRADHALTSAGGSAQPIATIYTVNKLSLSSPSSLIALVRLNLIKRLLISSLNIFNSPKTPEQKKRKWLQWRCHEQNVAEALYNVNKLERFVGATTNVSETEERRRWRPSTSAVRRRLSARCRRGAMKAAVHQDA